MRAIFRPAAIASLFNTHAASVSRWPSPLLYSRVSSRDHKLTVYIFWWLSRRSRINFKYSHYAILKGKCLIFLFIYFLLRSRFEKYEKNHILFGNQLVNILRRWKTPLDLYVNEGQTIDFSLVHLPRSSNHSTQIDSQSYWVTCELSKITPQPSRPKTADTYLIANQISII